MTLHSELPVAIPALGLIAMGVVALLRPAHIASYFALRDLTADFRNEIRAVYGGFGVVFGVVLLLSGWLPQHGDGIRCAAVAALAGMVLGRLIGLLCEGSGRWPKVFGLIEFCAAVAIASTLFHT